MATIKLKGKAHYKVLFLLFIVTGIAIGQCSYQVFTAKYITWYDQLYAVNLTLPLLNSNTDVSPMISENTVL